MIYKKISLNKVFNDLPKGNNAILHCYVNDKLEDVSMITSRPAVLICPGGGYRRVSPREFEPIAFNFLSKGYNTFVLDYSVDTKVFPQQILEVSSSVAYIRRNHKEFCVDPNKIVICGFSAGGHLAGSLATLWHNELSYKKLNLEYGENKPNKVILCYPVVTTSEYAHKSSFKYLLADDQFDENKLNLLSLEKNITENMPNTFIWHTYEDTSVHVMNSLLLMMELAKKKIPFEAHIYEKGRHGLSLAKNITSLEETQIEKQAQTWFDLAINWLDLI